MSYSTPPSTPTIPIKPHTLSIPQSDVDELKTLLKSSRLTKRTYENSTQELYLGVKRDWVEEAKRYWQDEYDWSEQQSHVNKFPQYIASLKTKDEIPMDIHFAALYSKNPDAKAVVFSHGWPGCWIEFIPMMEMVMSRYTPETLPIHIIIPSLPGFTHSSPPPLSREFGIKDTAYLWNQLMLGLGFNEYYAQGGDIGSFLSWQLARDYEGCKGLHINFLKIGTPPKGTAEFDQMLKTGGPKPHEMMKGMAHFGYALEQATRPSAIGMVVGSNPLALLAWTGEKYLEAAGIPLPMDTLLTFVSLYWFTDCYSTGIWFYRYVMGIRVGPGSDPSQSGYLDKPLGYSQFPNEITKTPMGWVKKLGDLVWSKEHLGEGGHFAALECPELLWEDVLGYLKVAEAKVSSGSSKL